jgi:hypothetical protein
MQLRHWCNSHRNCIPHISAVKSFSHEKWKFLKLQSLFESESYDLRVYMSPFNWSLSCGRVSQRSDCYTHIPPEAFPIGNTSTWMCEVFLRRERSIAGPIVCSGGDVASRSLVIAYSATARAETILYTARSDAWDRPPRVEQNKSLDSAPCWSAALVYVCVSLPTDAACSHSLFNGHPWWATCRRKSHTVRRSLPPGNRCNSNAYGSCLPRRRQKIQCTSINTPKNEWMRTI